MNYRIYPEINLIITIHKFMYQKHKRHLKNRACRFYQRKQLKSAKLHSCYDHVWPKAIYLSVLFNAKLTYRLIQD